MARLITEPQIDAAIARWRGSPGVTRLRRILHQDGKPSLATSEYWACTSECVATAWRRLRALEPNENQQTQDGDRGEQDETERVTAGEALYECHHERREESAEAAGGSGHALPRRVTNSSSPSTTATHARSWTCWSPQLCGGLTSRAMARASCVLERISGERGRSSSDPMSQVFIAPCA
ncbi:MAG: hypothetical protein JOY56_05805 [Solirubrobacterales bacterium]|nr:hypothetical protein [Solirubrobacterales bacterium]